jgi:glycosyltransferase involved in cell wall biosynthesis
MSAIAGPRVGPALALIGAFPFPYPQGSQIYMADQARALARSGARPTIFTYGRGQGEAPTDLRLAAVPRWASPTAMRSGPQIGKPLADLALLATWLRAGRGKFAFALAHNAEAALIALAARGRTGVRVVYVAHTILRHELSAYADPRWQSALDRLGGRIDRLIARRADAIITLGDEPRRELEPLARGPIAVLPPGHDPLPTPAKRVIDEVCARHDLTPQQFILYSGNLDRYQDLDLLVEAANRLPDPAPTVVIATHDASNGIASLASGRATSRRLRVVEVSAFSEMRALIHAAHSLVLTRRRTGGFPIKLLNYMEAARPIVAFADVAPGLRDDESARLLDRDDGADALARILSELWHDPALCTRLGAAARHHLESRHDWNRIAEDTLAFLADLER